MAQLALVAYRWNKDVFIEVRTHALDDLMIEEPIGLGLATEDLPLAPPPRSDLCIRRTPTILQPPNLRAATTFATHEP